MTDINEGEEFLAALGALEQQDVPVGGQTVTVRGLSREENLRVTKTLQDKGLSTAEVEQIILSIALVRPAMTPKQVARWQARARSWDIERVATVIKRLSGFGEDAGKAAYKSVPGEPGE